MLSERFDEWEAQFLQEGRRQGWKAGEASLLTRQLQRRFGERPEAVRIRVRETGLDELEHWAERRLEASSLNEVFVEEQISPAASNGALYQSHDWEALAKHWCAQ